MLGDEGQQKKLCPTEDSSVVIECEHAKAGLIIGKKAATINMLQEKSGAFVKVATWDGTSATRAVQIRYAWHRPTSLRTDENSLTSAFFFCPPWAQEQCRFDVPRRRCFSSEMLVRIACLGSGPGVKPEVE